MLKKISFLNTEIQDLKIIEPMIIDDERGYFMKYYEKETFTNNGIDQNIQEENQQTSHKGVLRGIHFQTKHSQSKIVRVVLGEVYDVAVDLRKNSKTFGKWLGFYLSGVNKKMLYIPEGFGHGYLALSEDVIFSYSCGNKYASSFDSGIRWDDSDLAIHWPLEKVEKIILSDKDKSLSYLKDISGFIS